MKLEVIVLPVRQVDRAKEFYRSTGFREDIDRTSLCRSMSTASDGVEGSLMTADTEVR